MLSVKIRAAGPYLVADTAQDMAAKTGYVLGHFSRMPPKGQHQNVLALFYGHNKQTTY